MQTPITHGWAISYQKALFRNSLFEIAYVGRRAEHLLGAYNVNQVEIFDNGFLDADGCDDRVGVNPVIAPTLRELGEE